MIFTTAFWKGAGERALKTFIQTFIASFLGTLGLSVTGDSFNVLAHLDVLAQAGEVGVGFGLGATILSFCMSLGNAQFTAGQPAVAVLEPAVVTPAPVVETPPEPAVPTPAVETAAENDAAGEEDPADEPASATA